MKDLNSIVRYRLWSAVLASCTLIAFAAPAVAQTWPTRPITAVVPLAAGSASDVMGRVVLDQVSRQVGQPIVVENRPGAGGTIGANVVAKAPPDGNTILVYGALAISHALYSKLPYSTLDDFAPVVPIGLQPLVLVTAPAKGFKTLADLIAAAKARPGALNYASAGIGSTPSFARRSCTAASCKAFSVSSCSLTMMSRGVFAGTNRPLQNGYAELARPASPLVGTSGSSAARFSALIASATSLPSLINGSAGAIGI